MKLPHEIGEYVLWVVWSAVCVLLGASFKTVFRDRVISYYTAKICLLRATIYDLMEKEVEGKDRATEYHGDEHKIVR